MGTETVEALVDGGKASAAPPLGSSLGPLKVNIGQVISSINEKTKIFNGMKVPVKVIVNTETKDFKIEVGTPPASQLVKKEINIESGSGEPNKSKAGAITFEGIIKVTKMKRDSLLAREFKSAVKNIVGSCVSMGILIDGKDPKIVMKEINEGKYDALIKSEKTEADPSKKKEMEDLTKELDTKLKALKKQRESEKAAATSAAAAAGATAAAPALGATPAKETKPAKEAKPAKK